MPIALLLQGTQSNDLWKGWLRVNTCIRNQQLEMCPYINLELLYLVYKEKKIP